MYNLIGWVDLDVDTLFIERIKEYSKHNPEFVEFVEMVMNMKDDREKDRILRLINAGLGK